MLSRRFFLGAGATLLAAPAIVRVANLMPISAPRLIFRSPPVDLSPGAINCAIEVSHDGMNWQAYAAKMMPSGALIIPEPMTPMAGTKMRLTAHVPSQEPLRSAHP